jgi:hypothetical protein
MDMCRTAAHIRSGISLAITTVNIMDVHTAGLLNFEEFVEGVVLPSRAHVDARRAKIEVRAVETLMPNAGDHVVALIANDAPVDRRRSRRGCGFAVGGSRRVGRCAERCDGCNRNRWRRSGLGGTSTAGTLVHIVAFTVIATVLRAMFTDASGTQDMPAALVATVPWSTK